MLIQGLRQAGRFALVAALGVSALACDDDDDSEAPRYDARVFDQGVEDGGGGAGGGGPTEEHTRLSYIKTVAKAGETPTLDLVVYDFQDDEEFNLTSGTAGEVECSKACTLNASMTWLGWMTPGDAGGFDLWVAPVDVTRKLVNLGKKRKVSEEVNAFSFTGDLIVYSRGQSVEVEDSIEVMVEPVEPTDAACPNEADPSKCPQLVGTVSGGGAFRVAETGALVILIRTTLSTMALDFFNAQNGANQTLTTFGEDGQSGSEFSGRLPIALSPDSMRLAVFTRHEFVWRANVVDAFPGAGDPITLDLFETASSPAGDCTREPPYLLNEVRFDPVFSSNSESFYFVGRGDCNKRATSTARINRDDLDILKMSKDLDGDPVDVLNTPSVSNWINHDIRSFDLSPDDTRLAFVASRPDNAESRSIWLVDPESSEYDCTRGSANIGMDGRTRCEFLFDDVADATIDYRDLRFHTVQVSR